ncbi:MAG: Crp/Fnr family transcriptional regulator [Gemmatimonadota bacterium]
MSSEAVETLKKLPLFARLSDEGIGAVAQRAVFRQVTKDTILFRRGEPCQGLYIVVAGTVRVYRANLEGREQVLHTQGPGQALAEVPLFDGGPYPASARVIEAGRVLFLPADAFQWLYQNHPEIADATIRELGRRLRRMVKLVEKISLRDVPARVAMTLLEFAEQQAEVRAGAVFHLPRTQEQLAAELATTRESVSRALRELREEGVITQRGQRIELLDPSRLEEYTSGR